MLFNWPMLLDPLLSATDFPFLFFLSIGWYCGDEVFRLTGCKSLSPSLALPTSLNNNNNSNKILNYYQDSPLKLFSHSLAFTYKVVQRFVLPVTNLLLDFYYYYYYYNTTSTTTCAILITWTSRWLSRGKVAICQWLLLFNRTDLIDLWCNKLVSLGQARPFDTCCVIATDPTPPGRHCKMKSFKAPRC